MEVAFRQVVEIKGHGSWGEGIGFGHTVACQTIPGAEGENRFEQISGCAGHHEGGDGSGAGLTRIQVPLGPSDPAPRIVASEDIRLCGPGTAIGRVLEGKREGFPGHSAGVGDAEQVTFIAWTHTPTCIAKSEITRGGGCGRGGVDSEPGGIAFHRTPLTPQPAGDGRVGGQLDDPGVTIFILPDHFGGGANRCGRNNTIQYLKCCHPCIPVHLWQLTNQNF